ncbi:MAG: aminoglycoside phosphotransferase family protein [Cyanobacteriota bacterium]|nr:aminoglycoside phosphotransferase family protein [Cyanobacteriota bacterium]
MGLVARFAIDGDPCHIEPLGNGNVNATYRVETAAGERYVLQRLNTTVFPRPDLVMANLAALAGHAELPPGWQLPKPVPMACSGALLCEHNGHPWRLLTYIDGAYSVDVVAGVQQAAEIGRALGRFHALIHDLPAEDLADTLEGFHITPRYYREYGEQLVACSQGPGAERLADPRAQWCRTFVAQRESLVPVLEQAKAEGRLQLRPIHGDPKVNNVMLCSSTGCAVAMVDLDTVKPGLLHYDIGDLLRSGCNPAGEESTDLAAVRFDLDLARAMLGGYLDEAGALLGPEDRAHLFDAIRLIPFELGLRFLTDHLAGDVYFKVSHLDHNLERALVQFRLTESIESQEQQIRALLQELLAGLHP